jgi:outer membrane lipoprotein-sorting protein
MVSIRAAVTALFVGVGPVAVQADTNAEAFVAHQTATRTFAADVRQTFHWSFPHRHVESLGHLSYQAPGFLAMVFTSPAPELVLVRGDDLYIKRDKRALARYKLEVHNGKPTQDVQFLLGFFQNGCTNFAGLFDSHVTMGMFGDLGRVEAVNCTVKLLPKHPVQMFPLRSVENLIWWPSMDVASMRINLIMGSYITYDFDNTRRNQPLDATVFEAPKR